MVNDQDRREFIEFIAIALHRSKDLICISHEDGEVDIIGTNMSKELIDKMLNTASEVFPESLD